MPKKNEESKRKTEAADERVDRDLNFIKKHTPQDYLPIILMISSTFSKIAVIINEIVIKRRRRRENI